VDRRSKMDAWRTNDGAKGCPLLVTGSPRPQLASRGSRPLWAGRLARAQNRVGLDPRRGAHVGTTAVSVTLVSGAKTNQELFEEDLMHRQMAIAAAAAMLVALNVGAAMAQPRGGAAGGSGVGAGVSGPPPHASTTGTTSRSATAAQHGANKRGFCPPGQKKKPGKGSAFQC
jgi:hypothetical protein